MIENKYNYAFYNIYADFHKPEFFPLIDLPYVKVFSHQLFRNKLINLLFNLHWSERINSIINFPGKKIWYRHLTNLEFEKEKPTCFIFLDGKYITDDDILYGYIKKINNKNRIIIYYDDLIDKLKADIDEAKNNSDIIISFDKTDAQKYGLLYFDSLCYEPLEQRIETEVFDYDIYFLGNAKDRLETIHKCYKVLKRKNLRCKFIICDVREEDKLVGTDIEYNHYISYHQNIEYIQKSECILEIVQKDGTAPTLRLREAQAYRRKLLTNNCINAEKNNASMIYVFKEPEEISEDFLSTPIDYASFAKYDYFFSSKRFIEFLERVNQYE